MNTLTSALRRQLEKAVEQARVAAELGAQQSLEALAVHHHEPWGAMDNDQRALRRRLRAHGRQLGDLRNSQSGLQDLDRLTEEVAYEFWHRMLFARFLAENELLMYPDPEHPVAVSLEECEQLAGEEGAANGWELAARFAARMLPQIFRPDSPIFQLTLPPEHQQKLERLVGSLPAEIFFASDSLGWVYQFWQSRKKEAVNAAGEKIGATELPAVTQLFTEPYMVSFLLDNSLGAWWAARTLADDDLRNAHTEEELRDKAAIRGVPLGYLRFVRQDDGTWTPAAGTFDGWPGQLAELKVLDPCCGSGHFLVAVFLMLVPMRMERDGMGAKEAVDAVLRENLHGLELDQRCVELAAFALALTAWRYPDSGGYRPLPELHLACSGLSVSVAKEEWKQLGLGKHNLTIALDWMHETFRDAPVLGSLINPASSNAAKIVQWQELADALDQALSQERSEQQQEAAVVAQGLAKAASLLAGQYQWVVTNVPYLARRRQEQKLRDFAEQHHKAAKNDLATVFLDRCLDYCVDGGSCSIVLPQNWLFLTSYSKFRENLLNKENWHLIARLGAGAFETISGEVVKAVLIIISRRNSAQSTDALFTDNSNCDLVKGVDVSDFLGISAKASELRVSNMKSFGQKSQLDNPNHTITFDASSVDVFLSDYANSYQGAGLGDIEQYRGLFWEIDDFYERWEIHASSPSGESEFSGMHFICRRRDSEGNLDQSPLATIRGTNAWGKQGVACAWLGKLPASLYLGSFYDNSAVVVLPKQYALLPPIWTFMSSGDFNREVRKINQKNQVANATLVQVPFNRDYWTKRSKNDYPKGLPKAYTADLTQWIFHGHPCGSVIWDDQKKWTAHGSLRRDDTVLQVAVARLLGYCWPAELDKDMELADEQREWVNRCEALHSLADEDGIVCIPPICGEAAAADRLRELLKASYGNAWFASTERELLAASSGKGKAASSLDQWLREQFFAQHCKFFQSRPFIWHIWDGSKDGFHALVNYHKLAGPGGQGRRTLEALTYSYLGEWIDRQRSDQKNEVEGSDARLAAALTLQGELEKILMGEPPYDLFVRWKPLHEQSLGWNPDINDGVRLNIRPFVLAQDMGRKSAGILRCIVDKTWTNAKKPGVKDRGKEVESIRPRDEFPWCWGCDPEKISAHRLDFGAPLPDAVPAGKKFDGQRWNKLHYSRTAREAARAAKSKKS